MLEGEIDSNMQGDNSDTNKRDMFNRTFESLLINLVRENLDFYNKISNPERSSFMKGQLYENFARILDDVELRSGSMSGSSM